MMLRRLWNVSPPLLSAAAAGAALIPLTAVALVVDPSTIVDAPAWLKPLKFAVSTAIYALSVAWLLTYVDHRTRSIRAAAWTVAIVLMLELALIDFQAWRGTTSHFNVSTPLNAAIFGIMGLSITALTFASVIILKALITCRFEDAAVGHMVRASLAITVAGTALTGMLMTAPRPSQIDEIRIHGNIAIIGGHTIGAADGGSAVTMIGWSNTHGDLRPAHFAALHALQFMPLLFWLSTRARKLTEEARLRRAHFLTTGYAILVGALTFQALSGVSVVAIPTPEQAFRFCTLIAGAAWLLLITIPNRPEAVGVSDRWIPTGFAIVYCAIVAAQWRTSGGNFQTLSGVAALFANRWLLLAGWIHYLAFDLFLGGWMVRRRRAPRLVLTLCLLLTFLFGPAGLLLYLAVERRA